jgi:hypothetical protein
MVFQSDRPLTPHSLPMKPKEKAYKIERILLALGHTVFLTSSIYV